MNRFPYTTLAVLSLLVAACGSPTPTVAPPPPDTDTVIDCSDVVPGSVQTCRMSSPDCNFRPDVNGDPTFCNHPRPFPNHDFTLLFWNEDRSDLDGQCVIVTGFVSSFEGKPQITGEDLTELNRC